MTLKAGLLILSLAFVFAPASAEKLVVVEARGIGSTAGQIVDSATHLNLRVGEHVRLIGENGNQYCIDGPYDGPARPLHHAAGNAGIFSRVLDPEPGRTVNPLTDCIR